MAATAASEEEGPVQTLISKRLRALRKKLKSNPSAAAFAIDELESLRLPLSAAVSAEIRLAASTENASVDELQISKDMSTDIDQNGQKSKKLHSNKKRKSCHIEATDGNIEGTRTSEKAHSQVSTIEIASTIHKSNIDGSLLKKKKKPDKKHKPENSTFANEDADSNVIENQNQIQNLSQNFTNLEPQINSSKEQSEVASEIENINAGMDKQPNKGALWAQKSSWTDLVGGTNASFSISQLLPDKKFEKIEKVEQPNNWFSVKSCVSKPSETMAKSANGVAFSDIGIKKNSGVVNERAVRAPFKYSIGETCSFMRSDASMKEWKSAKAALSASLKKKIDKKK